MYKIRIFFSNEASSFLFEYKMKKIWNNIYAMKALIYKFKMVTDATNST